MNIKIKVLDGLMGACIGDALGVPAEFSSRSALQKKPITDMIGYGYWHQPAGTWSDDSSLMLCLADSLCDGYNVHDIAEKFVMWRERGYWTATGDVFDIGNATLKALVRIESGVDPKEAGGKDVRDNGNGSLMRILPIAYMLENCNDQEYKFKIIHEVSSITHGHPRSLLACSMYVQMAINLLKGDDPKTAYNKMKKEIINYYSKSLDYKYELRTYSRFLEDDISMCAENEIASGVYVVDTIEAATWCFLTSSSYSETVLKAVNLGGDTDTTAIVAGGLAGIYYEFENIPKKWVDGIARKDDIINLAYKLHKKIYKKIEYNF